MFNILISNQYRNASELSNPDLGLLNVNFIPQAWTSDERPKRLVFNDSKATSISIEETQTQWPVVFDTSYLSPTSSVRRHAIERMLAAFHDRTNHSMQAGFIQPWMPLDEEQTKKMIESPFERDRYGRPDVLKLIQFIVCGAHGYSEWDKWSAMLKASYEAAAQYNKPIYAALTPAMYLTKRIIEPDKMAWIIREVYGCKYDGLILYDYNEGDFDIYYEVVLTALNQINE